MKRSKNRSSFLIFLILLFGLIPETKAIVTKTKNAGSNKFQTEKTERVYVIQAPTTDLEVFREIAKTATKLKPYGKVEINISELADKGFYEIPPGRNFWYEYASYNPTPYKFFPDPKIAPFIPEEFVKKNRGLLLAKAEILREYGLGAAFWSYEPNFLPEEFFETYPEMLGARVDHPRRGNHAAFAPCIDVQETQEMFAAMVAELLKNVPQLHTFFFKTNDAGSGMCWADWLYTGPNGPAHCKHTTTGERMEILMNTFKKGAEKAGQDISIFLTGSMFTDEEKRDIYNHLPENCYFQSHNSDEVKAINSKIVGNYPVRGMIDPMEIIRNINVAEKDSASTVFLNFRASYDRACEHPDAIDKFIDILVYNLKNQNSAGSATEQQQMYHACIQLAGENNAHQLADVFLALEKAGKYKSENFGNASGIYWGVTARHITRPLVAAPNMLKPEEETYFLTFVFNPSEEEARMDYTDIHGVHQTITSGVVPKYVSMLDSVIVTLDNICENSPEKVFLQNMTKVLRIQKSIFRSIGNFAEAQAIRDRNAGKLALPPHRPDKVPTWDGDPDLQAFNRIMRDELDNTLELIRVLENGGMEFISHANNSKYEDTFLLGPDLIDQLKMKRKVMLNHWTDIEGFMATPFK